LRPIVSELQLAAVPGEGKPCRVVSLSEQHINYLTPNNLLGIAFPPSATIECLEMSTRIGCSGWSYDDWVGPFYPAGSKPEEYLRLYSKIFDIVEIDSTFYRVPSSDLVKQWYSSTPDGFIFCPKLPRRITHDLHLEDASSYVQHFTKRLSLLEEKLGPFVVQLPPSFKQPKNLQALSNFVENLDDRHKYAIEFRHQSWFSPDILKLLESKNVCQIWSINQYLTTPATTTADFILLRFVGDRSISRFDRVQKNQTEPMKEWNSKFDEVGISVRERFVFFNNHFAGFGPGSVNEFRRLMGLAELDWAQLAKDSAQKTMFDF
jgi:uncharacterized protein YecE (DUF72 family)